MYVADNKKMKFMIKQTAEEGLIVQDKSKNDVIYHKFNSFSDHEWYKVVIQSLSMNKVDGVELPGFPTKEIQEKLTGRYGRRTLRQAFNFYKKVKIYAEKANISFDANISICDFACGWGRITRFFLKDTPSSNIIGLDCVSEFVNICRRTIPSIQFLKIPTSPPYGLEYGKFDIICAFSLFSHLNEKPAKKIIFELNKLLKPNGILVVTSRGYDFMEYCESLRQKHKSSLNNYHQQLCNCFIEIDQDLKRYREGKFIYYSCGGGGLFDEDMYGEAAVPPEWFAEICRDKFELLGHEKEDSDNDLDQILIILKNKNIWKK